MALVLADRVKETTTTTGTGTVTLAGAATGYQSFAAIGDANTTYYCIAGQTGGEWEVGIGTYTASGTTLSRTTVLASSSGGSLVSFSSGTKDVFVTYPSEKAIAAGTGGSSGQVQYNDGAGGFAGAANVSIDSDDLVLTENASFTVPGSNSVKLIARDIATRFLPAYVGSSGLDSALQPLLGRNKVGYWSGIAGATTNTGMGVALTGTGTSTSSTWATTNLISTMNRLDFRATTASSSTVSGFRGRALNYWRGDSAGLGGFTYICRWGIGGLGTNVSTIRAFVGLRTSTSAPTDVAPSTLTNAVGMGWDNTDSTVQIYSCGSANSKIDTGITLNRVISTSASAQVFEIAMFCPPNGSSINYTVTELGTSNTYSTTVTTTTALPSSTTALNVYGYTSAGGTSTSMSIAVCGIYIETDY